MPDKPHNRHRAPVNRFLAARILLGIIRTGVTAFSGHAELLVSSFNDHRIYRYSETNGAFLGDFVSAANNGGSNGVTLPLDPENRFFRLVKP